MMLVYHEARPVEHPPHSRSTYPPTYQCPLVYFSPACPSLSPPLFSRHTACV